MMFIQCRYLKKRKITQRFLLLQILVASLVSFCLTGCSARSDDTKVFDVAQLENEDGTFQYQDIPFGSSYEEAAKKIPLTFTKMESESSPSVATYCASIEFYGEKAVLYLDFSDDRLDVVKVQFNDSKNGEMFDQIVQQLVSQYGEADTHEGENATKYFTTLEIYKWEQEETFLNAILTKTESEFVGVVGVGTILN
ncbi:MAG: hypothetical protein K1W16_14880 [Lachnospiraceae bacterium]